MTITIEITKLPPGFAVVVVATGGALAVEVGEGYTLPEVLGALAPALGRAIDLIERRDDV
jgi:hypothetical protein